MELKITPDELIGELQNQIANLSMQVAAQNILIRKLQQTEPESEEDKDEKEGYV